MRKPPGFDRYLNLAGRFLARGRVPALLFAVARKSGRLKLVRSDLKLLQELLVAWVRGDYRGISSQALVSVVAALLYFLSPVDLIPDWLPGVGLLDDLAVLAWVVRRWQSELDAFKVWRDGQGVETREALRQLPAPVQRR
ncbi:YkvA family protein [Pseudomonas sp. SCB32]|uniref:YkvA family protein n=1 Tax=Pseudomonas sp. SCB32 TaxID=2653853 RepID=UPI0012643FAE|nr:YkvA family protein [Pseudomonas sp. SCB32]